MSDHFKQAGDDVDAPGSRTMMIAGDEPSGSLRRTATAIGGLSPGYFPCVMATSIISTGTFLLGPSWLSRALLVIASAGFVVLIVAIVIQLVLFRPSVAASFRDPRGNHDHPARWLLSPGQTRPPDAKTHRNSIFGPLYRC